MNKLPIYQGPDISPEEREIKLKTLRDQTIEILQHKHGADVPKVTCPECNRKLKIIWMYRCLYCSLYFCKECAEYHFGASVPKPPTSLEVKSFEEI